MSEQKPDFGDADGFGVLLVTCPLCGKQDRLRNLDTLATSDTPSPIQHFSCGHAANSMTGEPVN